MTVALVDLGYGNLGSVAAALRRLGVHPVITSDAGSIAGADRVILPGVGAAGFAMERIRKLGVGDTLRGLRQPVLGICLGMQLLFDRSEEDRTDCLGIIAGEVRRLTATPKIQVPHMGWSSLEVLNEAFGLTTGDYVYFAHSFAAGRVGGTLATADHGGPIAAVVRRDNFTGAQFHPERSGETGMRFLRAWLAS